MEENPADRTKAIAEFLYIEGYAQSACIHAEIMSNRSKSTTQRAMKDMLDRKLTEYKELAINSHGTMERVHFLSKEGFKLLGINKQEITAYKKRLDRIPLDKIRHYLQVRNVQRPLEKFICQSGDYSVRSWNEFNDEGILHIKFKNQTKIIQRHSDALIQIQKNGFERLTLRLEYDNDTESNSILFKKIQDYILYLKKAQDCPIVQTFPVYVLLVAPQNRLSPIISHIKPDETSRYLLFLASEKTDTEDLFQSPLYNYQGKPISLHSLVQWRSSLLTFQNTLELAAQRQSTYEILVHSIYTHPHDSFFPMMLEIEGKNTLWSPDAYLRIRRDKQDKLFALIAIVRQSDSQEQFLQKIHTYELFLASDIYLPRVTDSSCCGCMIVVEEQKYISVIQSKIQKMKIQNRVRIIHISDCVPEKILDGQVWRGKEGGLVALLPDNAEKGKV